MMEITHSVVIDRPVEVVFAYVSDASNDDKWETGVQACVPDRKPGVGQQREVYMKLFGRRMEGAAEVTEYELDRLLTIEVTSGLPVLARTTYEFEPVNGATRVDLSLEAEPANVAVKLAQPLMKRMLRKQWRDDLQTLKELLENEST